MGRFARLTAVATALVFAFGIAEATADGISAPPGDGLATAPNRVEYVSSLEKICRPGSDETVKAMGNARKDLKDGRIAVAAHKFERASKIYRRTLKMMSAVPRPTADAQRLKAWFGYLNHRQPQGRPHHQGAAPDRRLHSHRQPGEQRSPGLRLQLLQLQAHQIRLLR
jgi:hypothetical protein